MPNSKPAFSVSLLHYKCFVCFKTRLFFSLCFQVSRIWPHMYVSDSMCPDSTCQCDLCSVFSRCFCVGWNRAMLLTAPRCAHRVKGRGPPKEDGSQEWHLYSSWTERLKPGKPYKVQVTPISKGSEEYQLLRNQNHQVKTDLHFFPPKFSEFNMCFSNIMLPFSSCFTSEYFFKSVLGCNRLYYVLRTKRLFRRQHHTVII